MRKFQIAILIFLSIWGCKSPEVDRTLILQTEYRDPVEVTEILPISGPYIEPILYRSIPDFSELTTTENKEKFIAVVLPAILIATYEIGQDRRKIISLDTASIWDANDSVFFQTQAEKFGTEDIQLLINRMVTHPASIILAQAAVESGWGSSRFFREANNLFGVWSYHSNEPRIAAGLTREDKTIYLRKYNNLYESITDYFRTVARARPYREFRQERLRTNDVNRLLPHLKYYSEMREEYVLQLAAVIRHNDLMQYDNYVLDPNCFGWIPVATANVE